MRYAMGIEYRGNAYHGWQCQDDAVSVQETLERALSKVANHAVKVVCAGRTDTGVHGREQVVHFDSDSVREPHNWLLGCNVNMPGNVAVSWVHPVSDDFHARFSALSRSYRYVILNQPHRSALFDEYVSWVMPSLDAERMHEAAQALVGEHDFSAYRASACQAHSPVRTLEEICVQRHGNFVSIDVRANAFLQHMVRNIAGVLIRIGQGLNPVEWAHEVLEGQDRTRSAMTASPHGLYFMSVGYPEEFGLPQRPINFDVMPIAY